MKGFTLIEVILVIVILGVIASIAMKSMTSSVDQARFEATADEMEELSRAIIGDERLLSGGYRTDYGYVGDVGSLPSSLDDLVTNPGGYSTWNGPYIRSDFSQNTDDYKKDGWNELYTYSGGVTINSSGGGNAITKQFANAVSDLTSNSINGIIRDSGLSPPGDSAANVTVTVQYPDGSGSMTSSSTSPSGSGEFTFANSIPIGLHLIRAVVSGVNDTTAKYIAINPGSIAISELRFPTSLWGGAGGGESGCSGSGADTLRPNGSRPITELTTTGCSSNWECVDEIVSDDDGTMVKRAANSYGRDMYSIEDPADTLCTIVSVTVYARARKNHTQGNVKSLVRTNGVLYEGTEWSLSQVYENYSHEWTVNPNTGLAWTWQEVINLGAGLALKGQNSTKPAYCTQVWVVVQYSD